MNGYGVLRGSPDRWVREDGDTTPHLQIRLLDSTGQPWRIAVNVQSDTGAEVVYWLVDPLQGHPILGGLANLPTGFSSSAPVIGQRSGLRAGAVVRLARRDGPARLGQRVGR